MKIYIWEYSHAMYSGGLIIASGRNEEEARQKLMAKHGEDSQVAFRLLSKPDRVVAVKDLCESDGFVE